MADPAVTQRHREQIGPTYKRLHTGGIKEAAATEFAKCGACGAVQRADFERCSICCAESLRALVVAWSALAGRSPVPAELEALRELHDDEPDQWTEDGKRISLAQWCRRAA